MNKNIRVNIKGLARDIAIVLSSCAIGAFGIVAVMIPNGLTCGGISGIARLVQSMKALKLSGILAN